ncbi:MAG TPA: ABC transporter permease [Acidimicrobiia bacterium]|nr:ABC transporter permease [Acidimicrobiia bacterium]
MNEGTSTLAPARRMWAARELAQRWRSLVAVGVLGGLAGGLALAALAGARRSDRAYARWRDATAAPNAVVFGTQVGASSVDYSRVLKLPEVVDGGSFDLAAVVITHIDGYGKVPLGDLGALVPNDQHLYRTLSRPLLRHGRLPDPTRADEIVVNNVAAHKYHLHIGQHVEVVAASNESAFYGAPPHVVVKLRSTIVGIGSSMVDAIFGTGDPGFEPGGAFMAKYGAKVGHSPNLIVRLKPGTDVDAFHGRAVQLLSDPKVDHQTLLGVPVRDLDDDAKRVTNAIDVETTGLLMFAGAIACAAIVLVGQAIARVVYAMGESVPVLRSLGFTRGDSMRALLRPIALVLAIASLTAVGFAIVFSRFFPVGLARQFDPGLGFHVDWLVLLPGLVVVGLFVLAAAAIAARRATSTRLRAPRRRRASAARELLASAPLPVSLGAGLAFESGRGERALPVRPAITGVIAAVLGIVAALGFLRGIDDALERPTRSGQVYDALVTPDSQAQYRAFPAKLEHLPQVAKIALIRHGTANVAGAGLPLWDLEPMRGAMDFTMLSGDTPRDGEVAIGPATARQLHVHVGERLRVRGTHPTTLRVTGTALLPESPHSSFDQGLWVSKRTMTALFGTVEQSQNTDVGFVVTAKPGTSQDTLMHALAAHVGNDLDSATLPQDVVYLRDVRSLPIALAIFLVLLALAALGHALTTAVRRRRHDLAILKAIGLRPRQSAACIAWLATTVGIIGVVVGVPLGIVAGRLAWRWIADRTPLLYVAPLATVAVVVIAPAVLVVANSLAALPARRAARLRTAEVLRTE